MDKQTVLDIINSSGLNEGYKIELRKMIEAAKAVDKKVIKQLRTKISEIEKIIAEKIANLQIQSAAEEFTTEMDKVQEEVSQINAAVSKKADEIDLKAARANL